ncbi:MAG: alpha-ketoglutarate-dependent dioxygenase AlkB [Myxococcales bacterium]|nr:alpha-ketoglutarate-dependent dioxygenase AlkB [Myxococcales bacterium]
MTTPTPHTLLPTMLGDDVAPVPASTPITVLDTAGGGTLRDLGAGDSHYHPALLDPALADHALDRLGRQGVEVTYQQWHAMPRRNKPPAALHPLRRIKLAMATPDPDTGWVPHYRFPVNDQRRHGVLVPMTPTVDRIKQRVEAATGVAFNHAVILLYRGADDCIGFHKDKRLDLDPRAPIVSVSLGAARTYAWRDDVFTPTAQIELRLQHGSMLVLGPRTNEVLYHSVRKPTPEELHADPSLAGARVSLTFRKVATFVDADGRLPVWVKLPQLDPAAGSQRVWMYYDNPEAPAGSSSAEVWVDHVAVLHLGATLLDSVGAHSGASQWEPALCADACEPRVGIARSFTPELVHEVILDNSEVLDFGSDPYEPTLRAFSVTLWMRSSWFSDYMWGPFIAKGDGTWRVHTFSMSDNFGVGLDCQAPCEVPVDSLGNYNLDASGYNVNDDQWHHLAVTFGPVGEVPRPLPPNWMPDIDLRLYVDGVLAASEVLSHFRVPADAQPVRLGHNANTQNRFRGDLDELRIVDRVLSPEWVAAEFEVIDGELLSEGDAEVLCP